MLRVAITMLIAASPLAAQERQASTWSARSASGLTLMGTYTAVPDTASGAMTGTWTLFNASGGTAAQGGWSAAKSPQGWTGAWRSIVAGSNAEYGGTFTADVPLKPGAKLAEMFTVAVRQVVSGTWTWRAQSGAWSIRAAP